MVWNKMKLSIVTSFYNSEAYIEEQSNSILSQSYQNWEWIIADDFSSDNTREKLVELQQKDSRIRLVELSHKKQLWWNPQIFSIGDVVCPIDGDDVILPKTFEKIEYYFSKFPEACVLHFNANKYKDVLPDSPDKYLENFVDNVYISRDNRSFLEGFERLNPKRTGVFGYLRVFRNIPNLMFEEHPDGDACSSNDGQWLLHLEEKGKSLTIPRTTYLAREHYDSENFRNWNIRGEVRLIERARQRRLNLQLPMPRKVDYFDDIYEVAESTYLSSLNWESSLKSISFVNFGYGEEQKLKSKTLFFDHTVLFDAKKADYYFIKINSFDKVEYISMIAQELKACPNVVFYCDNTHLQHNNRTGINNLDQIKDSISAIFPLYFIYQENRAYFLKTK